MDIETILRRYPVSNLDPVTRERWEKTQPVAFENCCEFLRECTPRRQQNRSCVGYRCKHMVESPGNYWSDDPRGDPAYGGYVYEGTFLMAAEAMGFALRKLKSNDQHCLNIADSVLKDACRIIAKRRLTARVATAALSS